MQAVFLQRGIKTGLSISSEIVLMGRSIFNVLIKTDFVVYTHLQAFRPAYIGVCTCMCVCWYKYYDRQEITLWKKFFGGYYPMICIRLGWVGRWRYSGVILIIIQQLEGSFYFSSSFLFFTFHYPRNIWEFHKKQMIWLQCFLPVLFIQSFHCRHGKAYLFHKV